MNVLSLFTERHGLMSVHSYRMRGQCPDGPKDTSHSQFAPDAVGRRAAAQSYVAPARPVRSASLVARAQIIRAGRAAGWSIRTATFACTFRTIPGHATADTSWNTLRSSNLNSEDKCCRVSQSITRTTTDRTTAARTLKLCLAASTQHFIENKTSPAESATHSGDSLPGRAVI